MFGSTILEVAIGLLFVFLLLSLLCSAVGEYIEAKVNNRAKYLRRGIALLLNDSDGSGQDLAKQLYEHGLVRPLYRDASKLPSYIPSRTFTLALWNIASNAAAADSAGVSEAGVSNDLKRIREVVATHVPNKELKAALLTLIDEANGDLEKARENIENWYDAMMDRVAGWYKRTMSVVLLALGFVVAAVVNVDTIAIARTLARDSALRASIVASAQQRIATPLPAPGGAPADAEARDALATANLQQARAAVDDLGLPLGWVTATDDPDDPRRLPAGPGEWLLKLLGLALTGFAVSQGAPFWFDMLNKFIVIRSTVKPSEKSQPQPSKDRPAPKSEIEAAREGNDEGPPKG
jgi:hypothetical protein